MQIKTIKLTHIFNYKQHHELKAVNNVTTTIKKGEFITIIGQTGSGKTTFIEHLNALLLPTFGIVNINGKRIFRSRRKIKNIKDIRKKIGVVFQFAEYQLFEETIEKDIIFGPVSMGIPKDQAKKLAKKYIKLVGLDESFLAKSPFSLSGGQKRRVAIAGILAMEPDILIFDEPTAGLDPEGEKEMYKIFQNLNQKGKGIVVVTHNLDHALSNSSRTIVFQNGQIIRDGETSSILYDKDFLVENELEPPKLVSFVDELEKKGLKIGKPRTINELVRSLKNG